MEEHLEYFYDIKQGTPEWFEIRRGLCTASEVTTGLMASKKGFETYLVKKEAELHLSIIEDGYTSPDMRRGSELEPLARQELAEELLVDIEEVGFIRNKVFNAGCSPDGIIIKGKVGCEFKCLNYTNHYRVFKEGIRPEDYNQIMFSMAITGYEAWYICYYNPDFKDGYRLKYVKVDRNEEVCASILALLANVKSKVYGE